MKRIFRDPHWVDIGDEHLSRYELCPRCAKIVKRILKDTDLVGLVDYHE
jgi:hypothetical protein